MPAERVLLATLCEYSMQDVNEKLSVVGIFHNVILDELPGRFRACYACVQFIPSRGGHLTVGYRRLGAQQLNTITEMELPEWPPSNEPEGYVIATMIVHITNMEFAEIGRHEVVFQVNNEEMITIPFVVKLRKPQ